MGYKSIKGSEANGTWNILQGLNRIWIVYFVNVRDHIPDLFIGFEVLTYNVDVIVGQH